MIDAILAVKVLPSLYFQMFHHAMYTWIIIIICVFLLCTSSVSDFIFLCTVVYHIDRRNNVRVSVSK